MFDILVYLFENYLEANLHPDQGELARELTDAGFDRKEISQAFDWLKDLESLSQARPGEEALATCSSIRVYADAEREALDAECRGFLLFLDASGIITPVQREWVIDRVLALPDTEITLEQVKWIALMVLWSQGEAQDYLFMEEMLFGEADPQIH